MSRLAYKSNGRYEGIVTYDNAKYTDEQLAKMKEEFYLAEKSLAKKCKKVDDSEYSYELGILLASKLQEYRIIESSRYNFWKMLREYVNERDNRKVITDKRDPYEYDYLLSKLPRELAVKYARSKWDHLFDVTTARKDERIYDWLLKNENKDFINNNLVFQNFVKCLKDYIYNLDTGIYSDDEMYSLFDDAMYKSIFLVNYMKVNNLKMDSNQRSEFFNTVKKIDGNNKEKLKDILDNITK